VLQAASRKNVKPVAGAASSATGVLAGAGAGFPKLSRLCRLNTGEHTPALTVRAPVVKTRRSAGAAVMVSDWVAELIPVALAVTTTAPAAVPWKYSVAELLPEAIDTDVTAAPQPGTAKNWNPVAGAATRLTVVSAATGEVFP